MRVGEGLALVPASLVASAIVLAAGCGRLAFDPLDGDGATGDAQACSSLSAWGNITHLPLLASAANDYAPALHPNGLDLAFHSERGTGPKIYYAHRPSIDQPFASPVLAGFTGTNEYQPDWTSNGNELYFVDLNAGAQIAPYLGNGAFGSVRASDVPMANGIAFSSDMLEVFYSIYITSADYDLGHATRTSTADPWQPDALLDSFNRVGLSEGFPTLDEPRQTLYIAYGQAGGETAIYRTSRTARGMPFGPLQPVDDFGAFDNDDPTLSADGLSLLFASSRPGGLGGMDLYMATRNCL
jgi:hypothetical protein